MTVGEAFVYVCENLVTFLNNDHVYTGLNKSNSPTSRTSDLQGWTSD